MRFSSPRSCVPLLALLLTALPACSGAGVAGDGPGPGTGTGAGNAAGGGDDASSGTEGGSSLITVGPGGSCNNDGSADGDGDGVTGDGGDCDDCDPNVGPSAVEVEGNNKDDNCNGITDEVTSCDEGLALDDGDPMNAARAMGICTSAATDGYGVVEARWVRANGSPASASQQVGILDAFGPNVPALQGSKLLAISSGHARIPGQPDACGTESCSFGAGTPPPGFPQDVPNCAGDSAINDDVGLELRLKAPANATGFRYRFRFYTFEFPEYVCTTFNDQYVALVEPAPPGSINGNISFDSATNPVSVNIAFFDACASCDGWGDICSFEEFTDPSVTCPPVPSPCCPDGAGALQGTGFDSWTASGAGGTSWLETRAPIAGGQEFTIRFAIWDTGDTALDSTAVLDDFQWLGEPGVDTGTGEVPN